MGGGASVEQAHTLNIDYATLRSAGINFASAYNELETRFHQSHKGVEGELDDISLHVLAIRQLSQNLKNQDNLERTRRRVLKSRSVPDNLRYKEHGGHSQNQMIEEQPHHHFRDEFEQADLDIIEDLEFSVLPNYSEKTKHNSGTSSNTKKKQKKPLLSLQVEDSSSNLFESPIETVVPEAKSENIFDDSGAKGSFTGVVSPRGTLYMGMYKINEKGIFPDDSAPNSPVKVSGKQIYLCDTALMNGSFHLQPMSTAEVSPTLGGKDDFLEISTLGSGASGVVVEAIHVPTLTIVALKMLPIYNQEKRQSVSRELRVLYKNLSEMRLIEETLNGESDSPKMVEEQQNSEKCKNVLSLYNAFVDPKSGMINLVVEYMDGGSLEDLVKQGGCNDERVLADIAYQTLNGLFFLHKNKNIHRDIKPANILCSSSGVIKIADFGISKALDKSTGFANSFVGTVCYMSPERINGEQYSFSCDIWSLGLTILAVAKGKFPICVQGEFEELKVIGGPGGYWAMMKAICDDEPPTAGPKFSESFNDFIGYCLKKEGCDRLSAKSLLETTFVTQRHIFDHTIEKEELDYGAQILSLGMEKSVGVSTLPTSSANLNIVYSIRLEHLDRVLDKLRWSLTLQESSGVGMRNDPFTTEDRSRSFGSDPIWSPAVTSPGFFKKKIEEPELNRNKIEMEHNNSRTNRSVHFDDLGSEKSLPLGKPKRKPLPQLNIMDINGDDEELPPMTGDDSLALPRSSSYFAATKVDNKKDRGKLITEAVEEKSSSSDYKCVLPRFDKSGLLKWKHLSSQLNLPLPIVLIAVRSRLGTIVDLDE